MYKLSEAASILVFTEDQEETDRLWAAPIADGRCESRCAWLKDRFGMSWQIVPKVLPRLIGSADRVAAALPCLRSRFRCTSIKSAAGAACTGGGQDGVRFGSKLLAKLGYLGGGLSGGDFKPTNQQVEVQVILKEQMRAHLTALESLMGTDTN